jgi:hypothetical protein
MAAFDGLHLGARPDLWQNFAEARPQVLEMAKPVTHLQARFPQRAGEIENVLKQVGRRREGAACPRPSVAGVSGRR